MHDRSEAGASPVVSVILVVFVTIVLAVGIFVFLGGLASDQGQASTGYAQFSSTDSTFSATIVDGGSAGQLTYLLNGHPIYTINDTSTAVGTPITLTDYAQFCAGDELTTVGGTGKSENLLQTETISSDINCDLPGAQTSSNATFDGTSWIVSTSLSNLGTEPREFIIVLTDGSDYEIADSVTLNPGETRDISTSTSSFDEDSPLQVGVVSPSDGDGSYTLSDGGLVGSSKTTSGWMGGPSAGSTFSAPYTGTDSSTSSSTSSDSAASIEDGSDNSPVALSTNRARAGDEVVLYATLATTKAESDETLVVQATRTNPTTFEVARSTYTVESDAHTQAREAFSIENAGEYVITASLVGSDEVYTAGTLTVIPAPQVEVQETSLTPTDVAVGEPVTIEATLENTGSEPVTVSPTFFESGETFAGSELTLDSGESTTVSESYSISRERLYQFHVGLVETATIESVGTIYPSSDGALSLSTSISPTGTVTAGEDVTFSATATHDGGAAIDEYQWDFGDGTTTTTTSSSVTRAYSEVGSFQYTVTAVADDGLTATDADVVTASAENILLYDGFESGSLNNWSVDRPNFGLTPNALTGAFSARLTPSGTDTAEKHSEIISKESYPQGSTYQITFRVDDNSGDFSLAYASQDDDRYTISYLPKNTDNPRFRISKRMDGTQETLAIKDPEVSWGQVTTMTIKNNDGEIAVTVTDGTTTDTLTATDPDPITHGGKFRVHGFGPVTVDDLIVEE